MRLILDRLLHFTEHGHSHDHGPSQSKTASGRTTPEVFEAAQAESISATGSPVSNRKPSVSRRRSDSFSSNFGHPAITRAAIVQVADEYAEARSPSPQRPLRRGTGNRSGSVSRTRGDPETSNTHVNNLSDVEDGSEPEHDQYTENTPLLDGGNATHKSLTDPPVASDEHEHASSAGGHGHAHGSMNMHALLLHVLGDALGNVGVIATGLIIWLTDWRYRFLFDPVISLVISVIILSSAMPLVRSASFILLQGVPSTISLDDVRKSISEVPGVLNFHELHVWQLSETKVSRSVCAQPRNGSQGLLFARLLPRCTLPPKRTPSL